MKKFLLPIFALSIVLGCSTLSAQATSESIEKGYISVSAFANKEVAPDVAEVSITVTTYDSKSMQKATLENKEIVDKIIASLKMQINSQNGDFIKTNNFNATSLYKYYGNKRSFDKYQVSNSVILHTKSIDKLGKMIDKSIELGATSVNNLSFSVSDYEKQCNELLIEATKKATLRANAVANSVPATLNGVRTMDVTCSSSNNSYSRYRSMMLNKTYSSDSVESAPTIIEKGVVKVNANVNASFFVK